ncbi:MAG TPA: DUF1761 domain-containing protein [Pyrinomonadaceae bacterium]|nr:DUF1761 domain-containing protein [Pyrinomonadaceae bacterium]
MKINYAAVAASAILYWLLGGLWYSPLLFGNKFISLMRWTPEQLARIEAEGASAQLALAFVGSLVTAYVLAHIVRYAGAENARDGAKTGIWLWLGFIVTTNLSTIFEFRPLGLYLINMGYHLVALVSMGGLLAVWRKKRSEAKAPAYV